MEDIDDPDILNKRPEAYINNLLSGKLGDFDNRLILVCMKEGSTVGILIALPKDDVTFHIYTLGVYKAFRRQGIGRQMVLRAKNILHGQGIDYLTLDVHRHNKKAISLYKSLGFIKD